MSIVRLRTFVQEFTQLLDSAASEMNIVREELCQRDEAQAHQIQQAAVAPLER